MTEKTTTSEDIQKGIKALAEGDEEAFKEAVKRPQPKAEPMVDPAPRFWRLTPVNMFVWAALTTAAVLTYMGAPDYLDSIAIAGFASLGLYWGIYSRGRIPTTIRKSVRRLPVLRDPGAQRVGALLGIAGKTCGRCEHFDLVAGQEMLKHHSFGVATSVLNPSQMARTSGGKGWREESGFDETGQPLEDPGSKDRWHELGACNLKRIGVFAPQSCKDWS